MGGTDLLDEFATKVYEPPLADYRNSGRIADTSDPVSVLMLIVDFETEVMMNGIADFIGNRAGLYASETVQALQQIGCSEDAAALDEILHVAAAGGMTHAEIQSDRSRLEPYTITSFEKIHGHKWDTVLPTIQELQDRVDFERVLKHAARFIDKHEAIFLRAVGR